MVSPLSISELLATFGSRVSVGKESYGRTLSLGWPEFDSLLPEGGFPTGVVELSADRALGGSTSLSLLAVRAAQKEDPKAWCAWIDPEGTLFAPGAAMADVDLARLLVVRPTRKDLPRISVKLARSEVFRVIVIEKDSTTGAHTRETRGESEVLVRKLALTAAASGSTIVLITNLNQKRSSPLPVALRLELLRTPHAIDVTVAKERHGKIGLKKSVPIHTKPIASLVG